MARRILCAHWSTTLLKVIAVPAHMRPDAQSAPPVTLGMRWLRCRLARQPSHRHPQRRPPGTAAHAARL
jgi:hypothetical protein